MAPSSLLLLLDPLYCQEDNAELDDLPDETTTTALAPSSAPNLLSTQSDTEEELADLFASLRSKERGGDGGGGAGGAAAAAAARAEVAGWATRAAARHGFSALTALLAVDYLDRCFFALGGDGGGGGVLRVVAGRGERPWMGRLAAVACLALAAKVEETHVPVLLDLQLGSVEEDDEEEVEEERRGGMEMDYLFEARTVRRMELLVLSALSWRMNPVTPLSYIHPLLPFFSPKTSAAAAARLRRCEALLVAIATDWRWVSYSPSVWAAAVLLHTSEYDENHHLVALLNAPKNKVQECYHVILEHSARNGGGFNGGDGNDRKRKKLYTFFSNNSAPPSPTAVVGSCFSCETSSTSTAGEYSVSSVSSSPEPPPRKRPNCITADQEDGNGDRA